MVDTIKFSEMTDGGNIKNDSKVPGLLGSENVLFNNPWTFLPPGTTAQRPLPSSEINYRLRFNTDTQLYEYYDAVLGDWTQLQETLFTTGPYLIYTADASLPDAQNLGILADGILKQTISLGIATIDIAVQGTDYYGPGDTPTFDGMILTGDLDMGGFTAFNAADPIDPQDYATKFYVDSLATGGTVTSVALTMPSDVFSVAGSPITSSGTFAVTLDVQEANKVFVGPETGADSEPTFRYLISEDLPEEIYGVSFDGLGGLSGTSLSFDEANIAGVLLDGVGNISSGAGTLSIPYIVSPALNNLNITPESGFRVIVNGEMDVYADFLVRSITAGAVITSEIVQADNTNSGSHAQSYIVTGGASGGDPKVVWQVTGGASWSAGIDNSDSDKLVFSRSMLIGTNNVMTFDSSGTCVIAGSANISGVSLSSNIVTATNFISTGTSLFNVVGTDRVEAQTLDADLVILGNTIGNVKNEKSYSGGTNSTITGNTSDTASSSASNIIRVGGTSAGDALQTYTVTSGSSWSQGVDNSDSDSYVISQSTALGSNNVMRVSTAGEINYPLQPAFLANLSAQAADVTGDGTLYTILCNTEIFDVGSDYNNATGTFTAPVAGKYLFQCNIEVEGLASTHTTGFGTLNTSNRSYRFSIASPGAARSNGNDYSFNMCVLADMDIGDTATMQVQVSNSTKTVDVAGGTAPNHTYFSGQLSL